MRRHIRFGRGFTLVEILVVVGIIVLLIGILMPALGRAREVSRRVTCLSNLRQVHLALGFYAQDNHDRVPLGYRSGNKQFNSMVYSSTAQRLVEFGLLYAAGRMSEPRVFYCPSESDTRSMFNTPENPWPPDGVNAGSQVYCGYGFRPEVQLPDDPSAAPTVMMPKLAAFRNKAILADLTAAPQRVDTRHRTGVNVLYGNGSAGWVDRGAIDAELVQCPAISPSANPHQDAIWMVFDRR